MKRRRRTTQTPKGLTTLIKSRGIIYIMEELSKHSTLCALEATLKASREGSKFAVASSIIDNAIQQLRSIR